MDVSARTVALPLAERFTIARGSQDVAEVVEVEIRHGDVSGFGEAAPIGRYDESAASALAYVEGVAGDLGDDPFALEDVMRRLPKTQFAARAAIDAALHDLTGKLLGEPVWRALGLERLGPPTSMTIGLGSPDEMGERGERAHGSGRFKRLKLKLGGRDGLDVDRVRAVREVTDVPLQVDVNEYWTLDEALDALPQLDELGSRVLRAAAPGRRRERRRAEEGLADPDLRRRGLPYAARRRRPARPSPTGSTSSWRSPAGSERRSAWPMRPERSAWA